MEGTVLGTKFYVIWGVHRSGTSLLAGAMTLFGATAGENVLQPDIYNPTGYFEDSDLMSLNSAMLAHLGMKWHSLSPVGIKETSRLEKDGFLDKARDYLRQRARARSSIILKDPRMARLAPLWRKAFASLGITPASVVVWRDPVAVAESLQKRALNTVAWTPLRDFNHGLFLWLGYTHSALQYTRGLPRILVNYDHFLRYPVPSIEIMGEIFGTLPEREDLHNFCSHFIDPCLNHSRSKPPVNVPERVKELHEHLKSAVFPEFPAVTGLAWPFTETEKMLASSMDHAAKERN